MSRIELEAIVTFTREGFHCWPEATGKRAYLAARHRHVFYVEVRVEVLHKEREIEYHDLLDYCQECFPGGEMGSASCETMAASLVALVAERYPRRCVSVSVFEDNEVGAQANFYTSDKEVW